MDKKATKDKEYFRAVGRRKTAIAVVKLYKASKNSYNINNKDFTEYFKTAELKKIVTGAFEVSGGTDKFKVVSTVRGGGIHAQAEAIRHGISRALVIYDAELRSPLKKAKMLKRDPRQVERRNSDLRRHVRVHNGLNVTKQ